MHAPAGTHLTGRKVKEFFEDNVWYEGTKTQYSKGKNAYHIQ